ncbi:hypothetical protein GE300_20175 [Rhodobacteraceae bacterium 2CG4]|uniref:Uncharacterized protein n=1 Tax=Halovulum marinum TaxID=2662447 RepID=A0A6L5Z6B2_9RHOB|nr:hypothetical protein [Halovulum marinum]MSU91889.1 hypothetical protein [Halovulum marinum]
METYTAVRFGADDTATLARFRDIATLSGIALRPADDPERKFFSRIAGNSARLEDLGSALVAAMAASRKMLENAETDTCPFPEIPSHPEGVERTWRDGQRSQAHRLQREIGILADIIEEEIGLKVEFPAAPEGAAPEPV